ncbi:InlB B-repeat-containing protein, partial [Candidatus Saccharibacteria bacterium]|nr:InlB B-repeat-containing protein [Candidatus Saccharibacteria bacterium]
YSGDVLYTVLSNPSCSTYTIVYNANGGTGEMDNQTINVGQATTLSENAFTREGYTFLGWSNTADGKTGTAVDGIGTVDDVDYEDEASVTDISGFNTTKTLYAIWEVTADGDMQTWTGCSSLNSGDTVKLKDLRDGTIYNVKKFGDECWMTDNLILGYDKGYALTSELTNIPNNDDGTLSDNGTYYLPQAGYSGALNSPSTTGSATFDGNTRLNQAHVQYRAQGSSGDVGSSGTLEQSTGYYSFYAVTLGFSYFNDGKSSGTSTRDICPKGWRMPTSDAGSKSWQYFYDTLNGGSLSNMINNASFLYSGYYQDFQLHGVNSNGAWWSSTISTAYNGYQLYLDSNGNVYPQLSTSKYYGFATRCVAQNNYTVSYNANGGTGVASKASDSIYETGEITTAGQGTLAREGYNFLGWSLDKNATSATYAANSSIDVQTLISAAGSPASGSTITLYAVWEKAPDGDMQTWTSCAALSEGQEVKLRDTRDNKVYAVKKLPDGKCWMVQNLTLGDSNSTAAQRTLTSANTNIDNNTTYYLPPAGKQGSITSSSTLTSNTAANFGTSNDNQAKTQFRTKNSSIINDSDTGYYNFYTATLGYSYYQTSGSGAGVSQGSSTRDICPSGWRLPKTTDSGTNVTTTGSANDFTYLARQYSTSGWSGSATGTSGSGYYNNTNAVKGPMYTSVAANGNNYAGFSYSGLWDGTNTSASNVGSDGRYWSSSVYSTYYGYLLYFDSSGVYPQFNQGKYFGVAVRCIAKETMQEFQSSELTSVGDSKTLIDARDGKEYTVKKLPDGKVWMTQNLTIGSDGAKTLTSADTNIDNNTTYYLPPAGMQGDITSSSTLTSNTAANFSTSDDNQAKTQFRTKDSSITNDSDTGYYNFYTATLGYSYYQTSGSGAGISQGSSTRDICPKGWRLPKTTDAGTTVSVITSANDFTYLTRQYSTANWSGTATNYDYNTKNSTALTGIHTGAAANGNSYAGFSYAGVWSGKDTSASGVGSAGFYWSSSVYGTDRGYYLYFNSSYVRPQSNDYKFSGYAVRCIAK